MLMFAKSKFASILTLANGCVPLRCHFSNDTPTQSCSISFSGEEGVELASQLAEAVFACGEIPKD